MQVEKIAACNNISGKGTVVQQSETLIIETWVCVPTNSQTKRQTERQTDTWTRANEIQSNLQQKSTSDDRPRALQIHFYKETIIIVLNHSKLELPLRKGNGAKGSISILCKCRTQ